MGGLTKLEMVGKLNGQLRDMHMFALRIEVVSISELQRNGKQDPCNIVLNLKAFPSREDVAEVDEKFPLYNGEGLPHCFLLDTWGICFDVVSF